MGLALLFAVGNVFFEDIRHLTGIIIQSLYFLSPILYGPEHLQRLAEIQQWQRQGLTLTEIGHKLAGQGTASAAFVGQAPTTWHCFQLQEDLVVQLRADASPWRRRQLQNLLNEIAARMAQSTEENDDESQ
jgi:DNA-binding transcriptional MerR regulator